jgi:hypothetical protein
MDNSIMQVKFSLGRGLKIELIIIPKNHFHQDLIKTLELFS